jgi:hypothetical protein
MRDFFPQRMGDGLIMRDFPTQRMDDGSIMQESLPQRIDLYPQCEGYEIDRIDGMVRVSPWFETMRN